MIFKIFTKRNLLYFAFSPAMVFVIYDIFFYYIPIYTNQYNFITNEVIVFMILCDIFAIFSFLIISIYTKISSKNIVTFQKGLHIIYYYIFFLIIFFLIHYLIIHVFDKIDYTEVLLNYSKFYALSKRGTAWVFSLINVFIFMMIMDMFFSGYRLQKFLIFLLSLVLLSLTGGRSLIIIFILFILFIFIVIHRKKIDFKTILLLMILSLVIFLGNAIMRATDYDSYINSKSSSLDFDNAFVLNDVLAFKQKNPSEGYMIVTEDIMYMFIPRKIMPSKPISTAETRLVYPIVASYGTNYTFGIYANALLNIGYLAFFIIPIFIFFINYLFVRYTRLEVKRNLKTFAIIFFLFFSIQFIRGGIFNTRLLLVYISLIIAYLFYKTLLVKFKI